jgi:archaellum biogenesis protein FlaJ (TadC family)
MFHLSILARTRLALSEILRRTSYSTIYPTISSYMNRILAISRTLGWDLLHAIEEVGVSIPQKALSSTLIGFANVLRTKGNVSDFLERAMNLTMEDQRKYLERLKSSVSMLAMMYSVVMMTILFLNILQVTSATGKLAISLGTYALTSVVLIPLLSFLVLWMVYLKVPKMDTPSRKPLYMFLGWLPIGVLLGYIVSESIKNNFFSGAIGFSVALAIPSFAAAHTFSKLHASDELLIRKFTDFLHDLASERRLGIPLEQILLNMGEVYGPLNKPLRVLKMGIRTGMPMRLSIALAFSQVKSKTIRFMALLLSDAIVLGSATEETFNFMERMVRELVDVIDSMRSELRSISLTPYIIIIIEVVGIAFFITINPVSLVNSKIQGVPVGQFNQTNMIQVSQYFAYGTIITSFIGAFIIGLLRKQNPWAGFFHAGLILILIAVTLLATPYIHAGVNILR